MQKIYLYITEGSFLRISIYNQLFVPIYVDTRLALTSYLLYSIISGMLALITFDLLCLIITKRRKFPTLLGGKFQFILFMLFLYLAFLLYLTILSRPAGSRTGVDLMPFSTISFQLEGNIYAIENILLFLPFGFIMNKLFAGKRGYGICMISGIILSGTVELVQYLTQRGFLQTDDIILNLLGSCLGFMAGRTLKEIRNSLTIHSG